MTENDRKFTTTNNLSSYCNFSIKYFSQKDNNLSMKQRALLQKSTVIKSYKLNINIIRKNIIKNNNLNNLHYFIFT